MNTEHTIEWLQDMRSQQNQAESNGDYVKVRDICKRIQDFGLEDVYNR